MDIIYSDPEAQLAAAKVVADKSRADAIKALASSFGDRAEEAFDVMVKTYMGKS